MLYVPVISAWPAEGLSSRDNLKVALKLVPPGGDPSDPHPEDALVDSLLMSARALVTARSGRMTADVQGSITLDHMPSCIKIPRKAITASTIQYYDVLDTIQGLPADQITIVRSTVYDTIHITGDKPAYKTRPDAVQITVSMSTDTDYPDILLLAINKLVAEWYEEREDPARSRVMVHAVDKILRPIRIYSS